MDSEPAATFRIDDSPIFDHTAQSVAGQQLNVRVWEDGKACAVLTTAEGPGLARLSSAAWFDAADLAALAEALLKSRGTAR